MKLANKSIVVTGASAGMGKHIVELFVKEGANVVAVARRAESAVESIKRYAATSEDNKLILDISDNEQDE